MDDQRVLILPPTRGDGEVTRELLQRSSLSCVVCWDAAQLAAEMLAGTGALLLTDAALLSPGVEQVLEQLGAQPAWSDLPVVLLCAPDMHSAVAHMLAKLTNVTLLDRPSSTRALVSAVHAAIRGRGRQYETREQLQALQQAQESLRRRERQLETLAEQLRRADRLKDEFLAMLAHELRNPLAPIRNASELLERSLPPDSALRDLVGVQKRQAKQLSRLVDDLLDVSRITQGRIELHHETVDVASILDQAIESVEPLIQQRGHEVCVTGERAAALYLSGDRARLVQCLGNLLNNAAKYTDARGHIDIEVRACAERVHIRVTDDGVGLSAELLPRVFELFVQGDRSLDRSQGGLGIGLSVVQRLIEMHGGSVTAHSDGVGHGAVFELILPLAAAPPPQLSPAGVQRAAGKRVLVVDDNTDAADSLALILNYEGHKATTVYSSADALKEAFTDFDPHFILLDIGLPGMDGYEVARRLRSGGSNAQLIALTGYGRREDVQRAKAEGFDLHMVKPVDIPALLQRLAN